MRRIAKIILITTVIILSLSGCIIYPTIKKAAQGVPFDPSTKYLVGFDYSSYRDPFGMAPVIDCRISYDRTVEATYKWSNDAGEWITETRSYKISDEQFDNIQNGVDSREIYDLNPRCADPDDVMDGGSCWLYVYGADDEIAKKCGGFCPTEDRFHEIRHLIFANLPEEMLEEYYRFEEEGEL